MRALALVVALAGCFRGSSPPASPVTPVAAKTTARTVALADALGFLPGDSSVVIVLELKELRASPLWQRVEPILRKRLDPYTASFVQGCQFDPISSLKRAALGLRGIGPDPTGVIVLRGYKRELLMGCAEKARAADPKALSIENGIVTIPGSSTRAVFTFADDTTLVLLVGPHADGAALTAAIDAGAPLRMNTRFTELIGKLEPGDPLWFVMDDPKSLANAGMGFTTELVMGSARIADGASGQMRMRLSDAATASTAATTLQTQVAAAASMFFDELAVTADDVDIVIRMRMSALQVDSMLSLIGGTLGP